MNEVNTLAEEIKMTQRPVTNPFLVEKMEAFMKERNQKTEVAFINALKTARFLIPASVDKVQQARAAADGSVSLVDQPQVRFRLFSAKDGNKFFPLFTDPEEYKKWNDSSNHNLVVVRFAQLCAVMEKDAGAAAAGCVINPFSHNQLLSKELMLHALRTEAIAPGTQIKLGMLTKEPTELLDAARSHIAALDEVKKAYLCVMKREDKEHTNFLIVVDVDLSIGQDAVRELFGGIAQAVRPQLHGVELSIVPVDSPIGQAAMKIPDLKPLYEK